MMPFLLARAVSAGKQTASDNFDSYANNSLLSGQSSWLKAYTGTDMKVVVVSGNASVVGNGSDGFVYWNAGTWAADQWSEVVGSGISGAESKVIVRCSGGYFYYGYVSPSFGGYAYIKARNAGSDVTNVGAACSYSNSDTIRLLVTGTGSATRLTLYVNGVAKISNWDPGSGNYYNSGNPGVSASNSSTGGPTSWNASDN